jgi:5'-nucleotidase (lipoprotein e(P4) family)
MNKAAYKFLFAFSISATAVVSLGFKPSDIIDSITQSQLNDQSVLSVNWVQQSGEYTALAYQAFNSAKVIFDQAQSKKIENPAVVVDIDETILDNSPYQAGLINTNNQFSSNSWNEWIIAEKATATPGAVDFVNYVNSHKGTVFFVSDRNKSSDGKGNDLELSTMNNLKALGFSGVTEETVLLKGEFSRTIAGKVDTSKQYRREAIENGSVKGVSYQTVLLVGDNLNDFDHKAGNSNPERRAYVTAHRDRYGVKSNQPAYVLVPNPMYGAWEQGLYSPAAFQKKQASELSPAEKNAQRQEALLRWVPK